MPSWNDYALKKLDLLSDDLNLQLKYSTKEELKQLDKKHLLTLIESYIAENPSIDKMKYEKQIFHISDENINAYKAKETDFISKFSRINASFVTTNYDNVLEKYFNFLKKDNLLFDENYLLNPREVLHIHGDIDSSNGQNFLVTTWLDYYDLYFKNEHSDPAKSAYIQRINKFLGDLFEKNEVLIIGYSIAEIEILKFIFNKIKDKKDSSNITILVLKRDNTEKSVLHNLYQELGLNVIFLNIDDKGYSVLFDFLEKLSSEFPIDSVEFDSDITNIL